MHFSGRRTTEGLDTAIETAGFVPEGNLARVLSEVDHVLMDIKHMDGEKHRAFTGQSNERILSNARYTASHAKELIIRVPVIPTFNDTEEGDPCDRRIRGGTARREKAAPASLPSSGPGQIHGVNPRLRNGGGSPADEGAHGSASFGCRRIRADLSDRRLTSAATLASRARLRRFAPLPPGSRAIILLKTGRFSAPAPGAPPPAPRVAGRGTAQGSFPAAVHHTSTENCSARFSRIRRMQ